MPKKNSSGSHGVLNAEPRVHQRGREIQPYGTVTHAFHLQLEEPVRLEITEHLNQLLADSMTLRDLYKKAHWQVAGPTFYQLHLLFDKHFEEQVEIVDTIAERIQMLGGLAIAMAPGRRRNHQDRASASRQGRGASRDLPSAGRPRDHHRRMPRDLRTGVKAG